MCVRACVRACVLLLARRTKIVRQANALFDASFGQSVERKRALDAIVCDDTVVCDQAQHQQQRKSDDVATQQKKNWPIERTVSGVQHRVAAGRLAHEQRQIRIHRLNIHIVVLEPSPACTRTSNVNKQTSGCERVESSRSREATSRESCGI